MRRLEASCRKQPLRSLDLRELGQPRKVWIFLFLVFDLFGLVGFCFWVGWIVWFGLVCFFWFCLVSCFGLVWTTKFVQFSVLSVGVTSCAPCGLCGLPGLGGETQEWEGDLSRRSSVSADFERKGFCIF